LQVSKAHSANGKASEQAQAASELSMGGHFDSIAGQKGAIDKMVKQMAAESKKDVDLKISCERRQKKNEQNIDDVQTLIRQMNLRIGFAVYDQTNLTTKIGKRTVSMASTRTTINAMKTARLAAMGQFEKATKDDLASIDLIKKAAVALNKFYKTNGVNKSNLVEDEIETAPKPRGVSEEGYGGQKSASGGIAAIMEMITTDLEGEVKDGRREDAEAEIAYTEDLASAEAAFKLLKDERNFATEHKAQLTRKLAQWNDQDMPLLVTENTDLEAVKAALATECEFLVKMLPDAAGVLKTEFALRIENRKSEEVGLIEAKTFLNAATVLKSGTDQAHPSTD